MIFRIDDVSLNTPVDRLTQMITEIRARFADARILIAVSPIVFDMVEERGLSQERPFPAILNAFSDPRVFYKGDRLGIPDFLGALETNYGVEIASHGLIHVDHRLLTKEAQELSILVSASIIGSRIFVPPFNKWNQDLKDVCESNQLELVVWEEGWEHLVYSTEPFSQDGKYYFHTHDFELGVFVERLER